MEAADRDIETLKLLFAESPEESFGFHVQQAAEKALKAWLALMGRKYPRTHDLEELMDLLGSCGEATGFFRTLTVFTPYAVEFRYDAVGSDHEPIVRDQALVRVEALVQRVRDRLAELK